MKIIKTNDGNIALILSPEESMQIANLLPPPISSEVKEVLTEEDLKSLANNAKACILEIRAKYGTKVIDYRDYFLKKTFEKYFIRTPSQTIANLERRGLLIALRKNESCNNGQFRK